jgi:acetolactate synthase-1/2/3 large subunit
VIIIFDRFVLNQSSDHMTIAEYIAGQLSDHGIRYVFGIPGGPSIPLMEALRAAGIEFILTANESAAGVMADVTARLTGIPGVCHSTFGPGATNLSTGVGGAFLDRSPVIVLTSEMDDYMINRTAQMNIDHQRLFGPITKATFRMSPSNCSEVMESAFGLCNNDYPGPVHIGLPADICTKEIQPGGKSFFNPEGVVPFNNIQKVLSLLEQARRPLLAVGLTAARLGTGEAILSFLDEYSMPVVITPMAKGIIPENHQCYAGVLFHSLSDYLEDIYLKSDLIIGLGYDPVEFNYESWMPHVPLIHFDTMATELPEARNAIGYTGQPEEWFRILHNLKRGSLIFEETAIRGIRDEMISVFEGFTNHFGPSAALKILQEELPPDVILTADVGSHLHLAGQFWQTYGKGKMIMTNGWSGMGFGLPAAIAAQLAMRNSTVACITGDGGFLMNAGEIITAKRYNLPVITVVFSDGELNLIKVKQSWKNLAPYGTLLYQGDLFGADRFFGTRVLTAGSHDEMRKAVIEAMAENGPVIINAVIDPEEYKWLIVRR